MKTINHSMNYFIEQRLSSLEKHKWATKLLGYDYEIIYKKGKENVVVDVLSRKFEEDGSIFTLTLPITCWLEEARQEWLVNDTIIQLIHRLQEDPNHPKGYIWQLVTL
jgi:hypothetical protein